ncbi:triose phosphate isomerase [Pholiota conissans]|uniref:Triosephosphate isomerase n=1 Tax=Pholiota conissans TaxID=109636 RepID=A0A9P5Z102_9AGAR|nr:triose phosphate isomerase [Pholiota conissans]
MTRQFFVGGNFKLNPATLEAGNSLVGGLNKAELDPNTEVVIAPPAIYLIPVQQSIRKDIKVAAQNCYFKDSGAFTGEISPKQLVDVGIPYVILGHSERRTLFHEDSTLIATKTRAAIDSGLKVILCIGETLEQREGGKTAEICEAQLKAVVDVTKEADWSKIVIAYEPVWAIGTGKVATPDQAQATHAEVRAYLSKAVSADVGSKIQILYGGSVTAANCKELARLPDVDGFLVGGASLKPEFADIINARK